MTLKITRALKVVGIRLLDDSAILFVDPPDATTLPAIKSIMLEVPLDYRVRLGADVRVTLECDE